MKQIDPGQTTAAVVKFLRISFHDAGFSKAIIGVSGGIDSSVVLALAVQALGADSVYPVILPYGALNTEGVLDAMAVIEQLHIPPPHVIRFDIRPAVDAICSHARQTNNIRKGNIMARVRMVYVFDQAKKLNALVVGTENRSEHLLGYFTRFGDEASDIEPIKHLYKTQVYDLARFLGIPSSICEKPPTAGLWGGQTDENELGFSYKQADEILALFFDEHKTAEAIVANGSNRIVVEKVKLRVDANAFKHRLPIVF